MTQYHRLLERTDIELDHRRGNERGYHALPDAAGRHVLLVDDTFMTGARVQSAASALTLAGVDVVAAVVIGRYMNTSYTPESQTLWDRQTDTPFGFDTCCLE